MSRKILLLNGSPRAKGNTEMLSDAFIEGARSAGHEVKSFNLRSMNIKPCIGCYKCVDKKGDPCIQKDDMQQIYDAIVESDTLVLASPMYFWAFTAQLKAVLDRTLAVAGANDMNYPKLDCVMLVVAGDESQKNYDPMIYYYNNLLDWLGWKDKGVIMAGGPNLVGDIVGSPYLDQARKLGASL